MSIGSGLWMMGHVEGISRDQRQLLAPSLDELVGAEHPVRVIDAFVDTLDVQGLSFARATAGEMGRPAYRPGDLLKLYIYGYMNQMRSSRRLEREAERNIEVQWLINRLAPSFKTIADFRRDHSAAILGVTRAFMRFCQGQALYGGALVAIDGTRIEAVASRKKLLTPKGLAKRLAALDTKIAAYLGEMDVADREEAVAADGSAVAAALEVLKAQRDEVQAQAKALADEGLTQKVIGEPEARLMKIARHGHQIAYNAQTAVDGKHGLIAAFDLTSDGNDFGQLQPMAERAKAGITAVVPRPGTVNPNGKDLFSRDAFTYDAASDSWTCPAKETLVLHQSSKAAQKKYYKTAACAGCALKPQCTRGEARAVVRHFCEDDRQAMHQRAVDDPSFMKRRRELAEHPFGHIKWLLGYPRFLLRGIEKARAELALAVIAFNLKRTISILGVPALLQALRPATA